MAPLRAPLIYILRNPLLKVVEVLVPEETMPLSKTMTMIPLTATRPFAVRRVTVLDGVIGPNYQKEIGLLLYHRTGRTMFRTQGIL